MPLKLKKNKYQAKKPSSSKKTKVILTIDVEYCEGYSDSQLLKKDLQNLLSLLKKHKAKATFFISTNIIKDQSAILKKIAKTHELASHGHSHPSLVKSTLQQVLHEIKHSKKRIEELGIKCLGFRAPYFLKPTQLDALLIKEGYVYDASLCRTFFPGRFNNRHIQNNPFLVNIDGKQFLQIPVSSSSIIKIPHGLAFMRSLYPFFRFRFSEFNSFYLHPYEFNKSQPFKGLPSLFRILQTRKLGKQAWLMFENLLESNNYTWISCKEYIQLKHPHLLNRRKG